MIEDSIRKLTTSYEIGKKVEENMSGKRAPTPMQTVLLIMGLLIGFLVAYWWSVHENVRPAKLEDADQNVNQLYDVLAEEFDRQYNLLDSLGYFKQMSPDVAECGHGNISGRFECYKALESLLPLLNTPFT
jgi:hypothetical protein